MPSDQNSWDHVQSIKEVIRHVGMKVGGATLLRRHRERRGLVTRHLRPKGHDERFRLAYEAGAWVTAPGQRSRSGVGSEVENSSRVAAALPDLLARLQCRTLLDVGCGDWNWMQSVTLPSRYVGIDVVPEVVEQNRRFERPGVEFLLLDAVREPLPTADVALCREVLFHLSFDDGLAMLRNITGSAEWLLATTDMAIWFNSDSPTGDFRRINLERRPFHLPPPRERILDDAINPGRVLGLWRTADLARRLAG
jgi:SAM-dependent methyltransferase